jgi:hypothetical protein
VVGALNQLARQREAGAVAAEPIAELGLWAASNAAQRSVAGPWRESLPGARLESDCETVMSRPA